MRKDDDMSMEKTNGQASDPRPVDCQIFADQLDSLVRGELSGEGMRHLRIHAESCAECGMQLRVQEHLVEPSLEQLETQVPEEMVAGMWNAVREDLSSRRVQEGGRALLDKAIPETGTDAVPRTGGEVRTHARFRRPISWLVPTLAAATLILLFSTGFLYRQSARLQARAQALAQQVEDQQHWMTELGSNASDPVARTAALAGRSPWGRALSRQDEISLSGLRGLLARAPGDRIIMTQAQRDAVLRNRLPLSPPVLRDVLGRIPGDDGVTAGELLRALDELNASPDMTVPTSELMALLS